MPDLRRLKLRVPASTSNLGPGFDFLGLTFGWFLEVSATPADGGTHRVEYEGGSSWAESDDLILRALRAYEVRFGLTLPRLAIQVGSAIPVGRGFGSSGAAVAAALLIAEAAAQSGSAPSDDLSRASLVELALELEGHPDNGTASLLGGCTLSVPTDDGSVVVVRHPVHQSLSMAVAWPEAPLLTPDARAALPGVVSHADAVENPRRLALLLEGLRTGEANLLALGVTDRLHESYRRALIPGSDRAIEAAMAEGAFAACLSGAGSGLVALGPPDAMQAVSQAMSSELRGGRGDAVPIVRNAPEVMRGE